MAESTSHPRKRQPIRAHLADGLSLGNGASGVAGILLLLTWHDPRALTIACALVFLAWGFDSVDGLAARGLGRPRAVGEMMDSLCDVASFGVLPAILLSACSLRLDHRAVVVGAVIGVAFYACVVLRLRRYTVEAIGDDAAPRLFFKGLPSPVGAMCVACAILAVRPGPLEWAPFVFAAACAPLMMSAIPFKDTPRLAVWLVRAIWPIPVLAAIAWMRGIAIAVLVFFAAYLASGALRLHVPGRAGGRQ
ncbi:MAG TPA: CDP-alcohol phosphatidyltransferase family protein [Steroidobacteraceae bacterium]|nr:CDP-alcohol phosphatidyltransferase family protein [Steroidobacteraceae bacterium]